MATEDLTTRAKILDTTERLLFTVPLGELTTRRIAKEAGVNIAAINYHFRSKEELVNKAIEAATAMAFERGIGVLLAPGQAPIERLRNFLTGYASGLIKFPSLTKTTFLGLFQVDDSKSFYGHYLKEMLEKVGQVIEEARGPDARTTALRVLSCVIFPFLLCNTLREAGTVDYADEAARRRYIDETLATLVGTEKAEIPRG